MITATGKLQELKMEYVGANETPKLTVELNCNGQVVPIVYIGDTALSIRALTGDPGTTEGSIVPGTIVSAYALPGFRFWEGNETSAPKTFTTELQGVDLLILGSVGAESTNFYLQGLLHDYKEETKQGAQGDFISRTVKLTMPAHKKGETLPYAVIELNVHADAQVDIQNSIGQFVVLTGGVGSYQWTPKQGKNVGIPQRNMRYIAMRVIAMNNPAWVAAHPSFQIPESASAVFTPSPAPVAAVTDASSLF